MTDAYFYVNIPYHRPATPSFFRLLQRWAGPLLLGTVLAALAWRQDHQAPSVPAPVAQAQAAPSVRPEAPVNLDLAAAPAAEDNTAQTQVANGALATQTAAHPSLVFHNCSMPRMEVKKDSNELITGVASVSSCDEAKVTLWDTSR